MTAGVYLMTHQVTGDRYVGQSLNIEQRWKAHRVQLEKGLHKNAFLMELARQYGSQSFDFEILEGYQDEPPYQMKIWELKNLERAWIEKLQPSINLENTKLWKARIRAAWTPERRQRKA
jgi:group I intron endonuclease